jgi:DNA-binding NtrC family response regulator
MQWRIWIMKSTARVDPDTGTAEIPRNSAKGLYLLEVGGSDRHRCVPLVEGSAMTMGSDPSCDVVVPDRTVSRRHCELRVERGVLRIRDLGSRNGLFAGGARVDRAELCEGSCFTLGRVVVTVRARKGGDREVIHGEPLPGLVGTSNAMLRMAARVRRLAQLSVPVLIRGETGTGKDLVARAIHESGPRRQHPFVVLNVGTLEKGLAAAELFGHDRGAFTGAYNRRDGAFVTANGGTLFLDEIAELNPEIQVQLLRALEQREVRPVGSSEVVHVDVRIIAATWAPLEVMMEQGRFREDFYHRLAVGMIRVPSLSERRSDVGALAQHFLDRDAHELGRRELTPSALAYLSAQTWRGNARQLRNAVLRAALFAESRWIEVSAIERVMRDDPLAGGHLSVRAARRLVEHHGGNVAAAARASGVPRSTFRGWLESQA